MKFMKKYNDDNISLHYPLKLCFTRFVKTHQETLNNGKKEVLCMEIKEDAFDAIELNLNELPPENSRFRLSLKFIDKAGLKYQSHIPIMLSNRGTVDMKLSKRLRTFHLMPD